MCTRACAHVSVCAQDKDMYRGSARACAGETGVHVSLGTRLGKRETDLSQSSENVYMQHVTCVAHRGHELKYHGGEHINNDE